MHISYLAWFNEAGGFNRIIGGYFSHSEAGASPTRVYQHTPDREIGANYARIFGLTGFKIDNDNQLFEFSAEWVGNKFVFDFGLEKHYLLNYFSFHYVFFSGSECSNCQGNPYSYQSKCYASCPFGTLATPTNVCVSCGVDRVWDG